ncbi:hypothetical protein H8A99_42795 [Bradyrhizobium sp. Arg68]|uniref:hypothetical protein n=1 Tax=Bradyrhizobium ivorense TaxID=2511166 RepID=UPI001E4FFB52|nr:hypothetical protein [Bradyrhizobium ivorense]MCC8942964.1 hypothetical protein [Bradyrhizobium ivorense]
MYFRSLDAPSHFLLGCVLDFNRKINFVGLYYSARPLDMSQFDRSTVVFVDPNDNVGLSIGDRQRTLIAVRQFVTSSIPARLEGRPKNCEEATPETTDGETATPYKRFRKIDAAQIEYCSGTACRVASYVTPVGIHSAPIIYAHNDVFFIDASGALTIKSDFFERRCGTNGTAKRKGATSLFSIISEACQPA